jgi:aryl-alcohol dehydrogenase-like predicted oxidoreductase
MQADRRAGAAARTKPGQQHSADRHPEDRREEQHQRQARQQGRAAASQEGADGRIDLAATRLVVDRAIERGITLFDTADTCGNRGGSETAPGEILGARRKEIVLATRFGLPMDDAGRRKGGARRCVMQAVEDSLRRLGTVWIDLSRRHSTDPLTAIEETLRALDDLVRAGRLRHVGRSDTSCRKLVDAVWTSRGAALPRFVSTPAEFGLLERRILAALPPAAGAMGVGILRFRRPGFLARSGRPVRRTEIGTPTADGADFITFHMVVRDFRRRHTSLAGRGHRPDVRHGAWWPQAGRQGGEAWTSGNSGSKSRIMGRRSPSTVRR